MVKKILYILMLLNLLLVKTLPAQEELPKNWNSEKIKGARFIPYATYLGNPFLSDGFLPGTIEMSDGKTVGGLQLRYSSYQDELIYYNTDVSTQIIVDKVSLKGFSLTDERGVKHTFRQQSYDGPMPGNRFFELLSEGDVSLLVHRKVLLLTCPIYGEVGKEKNTSYQEAYNYFLYNKEKGYKLIKITRNALLSLFDSSNQKLAKKILRKNNVSISDENSFVKAWNLLKENTILVQL
jgi:hypothetical protein